VLKKRATEDAAYERLDTGRQEESVLLTPYHWHGSGPRNRFGREPIQPHHIGGQASQISRRPSIPSDQKRAGLRAAREMRESDEQSLTGMTTGGLIAKEKVTPADDSVDAATVARWLSCSTRQVRQYAEEGLVVRVGPWRFDLERSIGNVILHLRELAGSRKGADGVDAVKASAALKDAQRKLAELRYAQLDAQVISLPEAEMLWADLVRSARRLFQSFPARARAALPHLSDADQATLETVGEDMLREIALKGQVPLPAVSSDAELDTE
jgi:phage terminase Nu1 subunit (DNA packaging protein)